MKIEVRSVNPPSKIFYANFFLSGIELHDISIPSGVYSDLEEAGVTESVLFSYNDVKLRWIALENWTYSLEFNVTSDYLKHNFVILTFDGLDTLTEIYLNDKSVGVTNNMFVRYRYNVKNILVDVSFFFDSLKVINNLKYLFFHKGTNKLEIKFESPVEGAINLNSQRENAIPPECPPDMYNGECHMNLLRKMQASFAWDWGLAAPSMGIWKNVWLEVYDSIVIRYVTYQLIDGDLTEETGDENVNEDVWTLKVFVHMETGLEEAEMDGVIAVALL